MAKEDEYELEWVETERRKKKARQRGYDDIVVDIWGHVYGRKTKKGR